MKPATTHAILHTVIIYSPDIASLAEFYRQGLDLGPPSATGDDHLGFKLPNLYLGFDIAPDPPPAERGAVSLWFEVDNLEATFNHLLEIGATVKYPPKDKPWGARLAAVFDPEGNVIGLAQRGRETD
jgi:predicted enzyme related to lactoylglutathione lyase